MVLFLVVFIRFSVVLLCLCVQIISVVLSLCGFCRSLAIRAMYCVWVWFDVICAMLVVFS